MSSVGSVRNTNDIERQSTDDGAVLTRMLHAIDDLDWGTVRESFTDPVATDYTSLWGGEPETVSVDDLIAGWREFAARFAATQHQTGPIVVAGDRAEAHVVASHWFAEADGAGVWTVHGHYVARLAGGRIAELTLHTFHAGGHRDLPTITGERRS
jgi:hypothetical protein